MKKSVLILASAALLAVGCTPKVARQPLTETEEQWQAFVKKYYPAWKPNPTLAAALQPTVPAAAAQPAVIVRENPPTVATLPESELVFEEEEAVFDAAVTPAREDVVATTAPASTTAAPDNTAANAAAGDAADTAAASTANAAANDADASSANAAAAPADPSPVPAESQIYVVQKGDMLGSIAQKFYGKASLWPVIQKANEELLKGSTALKPGMKLVIPAVK